MALVEEGVWDDLAPGKNFKLFIKTNNNANLKSTKSAFADPSKVPTDAS